jgi:hypothetical protein
MVEQFLVDVGVMNVLPQQLNRLRGLVLSI